MFYNSSPSTNTPCPSHAKSFHCSHNPVVQDFFGSILMIGGLVISAGFLYLIVGCVRAACFPEQAASAEPRNLEQTSAQAPSAAPRNSEQTSAAPAIDRESLLRLEP